MPKNILISKTSRIAGLAALFGTVGALMLIGAPANAAELETAARGVAITFARGV
ncbi:MAG TPA: hypothetical protein VIT20_04980 [Propionibacteriaceae bacterium]